MPAPIDAATVRAAPKVLLHDHLDGGLRPTTVLELADAIGWTAAGVGSGVAAGSGSPAAPTRATSSSTSPRSSTRWP